MRATFNSLLDNRLTAWSLTILWMGVIFVFSAQPHSGAMTETYLGDANVPVRKVAHITEFLILFLLFNWSYTLTLTKSFAKDKKDWHWKLAFISSLLYAVSDEWHQLYVPGRSAGLNDVLVDMGGVVLGAVALILWRRMRRQIPVAPTDVAPASSASGRSHQET